MERFTLNRVVRFKLVMLGDGAVGKTSLVRRYLGWEFEQSYLPTIGTDVYNEERIYRYDNEKIKANLVVWDISGQKSFREVRGNYYKGAHGALLVYDITREVTYNNVKNWLKDFKSTVRGDFDITLIGNKKDLEDKREVSFTQGKRLAEELSDMIGKDVPRIETSAKTRANLGKAFDTLIRKILLSTMA